MSSRPVATGTLLRSLIQAYEQRHGTLLPQGVTVLIEVEGDGAWQLDGGMVPAMRSPNRRPKDLVLRCAPQDFARLLQGTLDPRRAFLEGRLTLEGDVGIALRLQAAVQQVAA